MILHQTIDIFTGERDKIETKIPALTQEEAELSSSVTPKPGPPMLANAFKHLAAAILTAKDLSPVADLIIRRKASEYAVEAALPPEPSKAFRSIYNASCLTNS